MLPKARPRTGRHLAWPFSRRRNRRVRSSSPALPRPPRPPLWASAWGALKSWRRSLLVAAVGMTLAASAWAGRWYVTHARHFAVRQVRVSPTAHVTAEALIARANVPLGEVHVDRIGGVTVYSERGVGVRLGVIDDTLPARLARYDAVAAALQSGGEEPRLVYVDNRARPDRVTVKLASAQLSAHSGS